jgi:hypothetical protein
MTAPSDDRRALHIVRGVEPVERLEVDGIMHTRIDELGVGLVCSYDGRLWPCRTVRDAEEAQSGG